MLFYSTFSSINASSGAGPLIGTLLAVTFYKFIKVLEYEMVNPGQDGDEQNDPTKNPSHEVAMTFHEREFNGGELFRNLSINSEKQIIETERMARGRGMLRDSGDLERGYGQYVSRHPTV